MSDSDTVAFSSSALWPIPIKVGNPITFKGEVVGEVTAIDEDGTVRVSIGRDAAIEMGVVELGGFSVGTYEVAP